MCDDMDTYMADARHLGNDHLIELRSHSSRLGIRPMTGSQFTGAR